MKKLFAAFFAVAVFSVFPLKTMASDNGELHIIPQPQKVVRGQGSFTLTPQTVIYAKGKDVKSVAAFFASKMKDATGYDIQVSSKKVDGCISLKIGNKKLGKEGYTLNVTADGVEAVAPTAHGLFYAMQTFLQLLPAEIENRLVSKNVDWTAPAVNITDKPRFRYRGMHIDVCRHFMSVETIKKQLDMMAMFKLNQFHWHLTEDQGWRIEIKKYPELTKYAAYRDRGDENFVNGYYKPILDRSYGGYYTQDQVREVVAYATERFINVIPELEVPGHEVAAISAYPWLACRPGERRPWTQWGVSPIVMCPGKDTTFEFLENVLKEMVALFPGKYFHIGGDESPREEWAKCPLCQKRIKELGIKKENGRSPEAQLQSYVVGYVEKFLNKYGKTIIGWDEILEGGNLNKSAIVMSWRGEQGGITAANAGHHVIMTPSSNAMYLDHYQDRAEASPIAIGGYAPLQAVYNYNPLPKSIEEKGNGEYVLGPQGNAWTEYMYDGKNLQYRTFPRALAIAEIGWTELENKDSLNFFKTVDGDAAKRMLAHDINFHMPIPTSTGIVYDRQAFVDEYTMNVKTVRPIKVVYTTDGSKPTANSTVYTGPFKIKNSCTLRMASVLENGHVGGFSKVNMVKEDFHPATVKKDLKPGLNLHVARGLFRNHDELVNNFKWESKEIKELGNGQMRVDPKGDDYSCVAEGYLNIPEDGVYGFQSLNNQVYIDGVLVVDKDNDPVKRFYSGSGTIALKKGMHRLRIEFLGYNGSGCPSYYNYADVLFCNSDKGEKPRYVSSKDIFH